MNETPCELELVEALFKTIAYALEEMYCKQKISSEEYELLIDSVWATLGYGTKLPD